MIGDLHFTFTAELWLSSGKGGWYFITLPIEESAEIKFFAGANTRGWGSVRVTARIGNTTWKTSIFPSSSSATYVLPVKAEVRKSENLDSGDQLTVQLDVSI
jgi:hypothetical protein